MYKIINIKWTLKGIPDHVISDQKEIWKMPFQSGFKYYNYRKVKEHYHQGQIKYRINGKRYTKKQINMIALPKNFTIKMPFKELNPFEL